MGCIADLVEYRRRRERLIERVAVAQMPTEVGYFDCHTYHSLVDGRTHMALTVGIDRARRRAASRRSRNRCWCACTRSA
jgi:3,4-dihydroxy 2-butanone 4-phosphate synthase/GTP cyclohydrolase II